MFDLENENIIVTKKTITTDTMIKDYYVSCNFRLCIILNGKGIWQIGHNLHTVETGDIVILNNRQKRFFTDILTEEGLTLIIIDFDPQLVINTQFVGLFFRDDKFHCKISDNTEIFKLTEEIEQEPKLKLMNYHIIIGTKLVEILALIVRHFALTDLDCYTIDEDICKALEYIDKNYTSNISLRKTAELLHMSISSFSKHFSNKTKIGFAQYVMQKRIHHAIHLLKKSNKTVLEVSMECGYKNTANFYKAFRKITNKTPSQFRNIKDDYSV